MFTTAFVTHHQNVNSIFRVMSLSGLDVCLVSSPGRLLVLVDIAEFSVQLKTIVTAIKITEFL